MTRFAKIYGDFKLKYKVSRKLCPVNGTNREGYGYIKRRVGLLPSEIDGPSYCAINELSDLINKNKSKSSQ